MAKNYPFREEPRTYQHKIGAYPLNLIPPGEKWESVTELLKIINKPAIAGWKQKLQGEYCVEWYNQMVADFITKDGRIADEDEFAHVVKKSKQAWRQPSQEALDIGTRVHQLAEYHLCGAEVSLADEPTEVVNSFNGFLKWVDDADFSATDTEIPIVNVSQKYAGTVDAVGKFGKERGIVDFKTSKAFYREYALQSSAYQIAYHKCFALDMVHNRVVIFPKTGGDPIETVITDVGYHYEAFVAAAKLYRWERGSLV